MTSARGGSNMPTTPTNVQLVSYLINLLLSSRSMSSFFGGLSMVASARQRSVSRPEARFKVYADVLWITGESSFQHTVLQSNCLALIGGTPTCSVIFDVLHDFRLQCWCHWNLLCADAHECTSVQYALWCALQHSIIHVKPLSFPLQVVFNVHIIYPHDCVTLTKNFGPGPSLVCLRGIAAQLIDFLSRENSRVKSFFHIDWKAQNLYVS